MNSNKIGGYPEKQNLKLLSVDGEINLTEMTRISEDENKIINGILENMSKVEKYKNNFMKLDRHQPKEKTSKVNKILEKIHTKKLTETKSKES